MEDGRTLRHLFVKKRVQPVRNTARPIRQYDSPHDKPSSIGSIVGRVDWLSESPESYVLPVDDIHGNDESKTMDSYNTAS